MLNADDPSGDINAHLLKAARLAAREKLGILPEADREVLRNWLQEDDRHQAWLDTFLNRQDLDALLAEYERVQSTVETELQAFHRRKEMASPAPVHSISTIRRWWAVAATVLLIAAGAYIWSTNKKNIDSMTVAKITDIPPGSQGAVLTLADGREVLLDTLQNGAVALQGSVTAKVRNGILIYEGGTDQLVYNTVSTPNGRQYQVVLPDGTKVWLNSASSIRYPMTFNGNSREVSITGEVYFEVAGNAAQPFRVMADGRAEVRVLGTHFNVNAYENETGISTTLLEGKVSVWAPGANTIYLVKGQQAKVLNTTGATGIMVVEGVDTEGVIAWKNGLFYFSNLKFEEVMRQLERWYDIQVVYEGRAPRRELVGKMSRDVPLSGLLRYFGDIGIHCRLDGRKLIILP